MSISSELVKPDRHHLMTAMRDAIDLLLNHTPPEIAEVSMEELEEAVEALTRVRSVMEKHPDMQSYAVMAFFDYSELSQVQTDHLLGVLLNNRLAKCHQFLEVDIEAMEKMLSKEGIPPILYPWALKALHHAYHTFQQPPHSSFVQPT